MEREESRMRREEKEYERMERMRAMRAKDEMDVRAKKRADAERARRLHDKVKSGKEHARLKKKAHTDTYRAEARR